jgi:hypothetical protein
VQVAVTPQRGQVVDKPGLSPSDITFSTQLRSQR